MGSENEVILIEDDFDYHKYNEAATANIEDLEDLSDIKIEDLRFLMSLPFPQKEELLCKDKNYGEFINTSLLDLEDIPRSSVPNTAIEPAVAENNPQNVSTIPQVHSQDFLPGNVPVNCQNIFVDEFISTNFFDRPELFPHVKIPEIRQRRKPDFDKSSEKKEKCRNEKSQINDFVLPKNQDSTNSISSFLQKKNQDEKTQIDDTGNLNKMQSCRPALPLSPMKELDDESPFEIHKNSVFSLTKKPEEEQKLYRKQHYKSKKSIKIKSSFVLKPRDRIMVLPHRKEDSKQHEILSSLSPDRVTLLQPEQLKQPKKPERIEKTVVSTRQNVTRNELKLGSQKISETDDTTAVDSERMQVDTPLISPLSPTSGIDNKESSLEVQINSVSSQTKPEEEPKLNRKQQNQHLHNTETESPLPILQTIKSSQMKSSVVLESLDQLLAREREKENSKQRKNLPLFTPDRVTSLQPEQLKQLKKSEKSVMKLCSSKRNLTKTELEPRSQKEFQADDTTAVDSENLKRMQSDTREIPPMSPTSEVNNLSSFKLQISSVSSQSKPEEQHKLNHKQQSQDLQDKATESPLKSLNPIQSSKMKSSVVLKSLDHLLDLERKKENSKQRRNLHLFAPYRETSLQPEQTKKPEENEKKVCSTQRKTTKQLDEIDSRSSVKKMLVEALNGRIKDFANSSLSDEETIELAEEIELELFKFFNNTGAKYKAQTRRLLFNIKDSKNMTLVQKIASHSLKPKDLVKLSSGELASQELREWRVNETKHQLDIIKKTELELRSQKESILIKSHKGVRIIESEREKCDTAHSTSCFELNDEENWCNNGSDPIVDKSKQQKRSRVQEQGVVDHSSVKRRCSHENPKRVQKHHREKRHAKKHIDEKKHKQKPSPSSDNYEEPSSTSNHLPTSNVLWRGRMFMYNDGSFEVIALNVSGDSTNVMANLPKLMNVVGRAAPSVCWKYIDELMNLKRDSYKIHIVKLHIENEASNMKLFNYLKKRDRIGVIEHVSNKIKDFYIVPFTKDLQLSVLPPLDYSTIFAYGRSLIGIIILHTIDQSIIKEQNSEKISEKTALP